MVLFPYLNKLNSSREVIDHGLITRGVPPFDREVKFTACGYQPINAIAHKSAEGPHAVSFIFGQVDIAFKISGKDADTQAFPDVFHEAMDEMVRQLIASVYQRVMTGKNLDIRIRFTQWRHPRIVQPEIRTGGSHVGDEFSWMTQMQVPDSRSKHHNVSGTLKIGEDQFAGHVMKAVPVGLTGGFFNNCWTKAKNKLLELQYFPITSDQSDQSSSISSDRSSVICFSFWAEHSHGKNFGRNGIERREITLE